MVLATKGRYPALRSLMVISMGCAWLITPGCDRKPDNITGDMGIDAGGVSPDEETPGDSNASTTMPSPSSAGVMTNSDPQPDTSGDTKPAPTAQLLAVHAGSNTSCARWSHGKIQCWGENSRGQLGQGHTRALGKDPMTSGEHIPALPLPDDAFIEDMWVGDSVCARTRDGRLFCWGDNTHGQLGLGHNQAQGDQPGEVSAQMTPVPMGQGKKVIDACLGGGHACAVLDGGEVKCWGRNDHGQLGRGDTAPIGLANNQMGDFLPAIDLGPVPGDLSKTPRRATAVACGRQHTCVTTTKGKVLCWGRNHQGQLGIANSASVGDGPDEMGNKLVAAMLGDEHHAVELALGEHHSCARNDKNQVHCWGANEQGQLGRGSTKSLGGSSEDAYNLKLPLLLNKDRKIKALHAGADHSCIIEESGRLACWGNNRFGALGQGATLSIGDDLSEMGDALPAVPLGDGFSVQNMSIGHRHLCAIDTQHRLKCWGYNAMGQLGLGHANTLGERPETMGNALMAVKLRQP